MLTEKQKMEEELNSVLTVEFESLEKLAKVYHQRRVEFKNALPHEIISASARDDAATNAMFLEENYLRGIIYLARRLNLITPKVVVELSKKIDSLWKRGEEDETFK